MWYLKFIISHPQNFGKSKFVLSLSLSLSLSLFYDLYVWYLCFAVAEHLIAQHSSIKMLHSRVKLILEYIKAVQSGMYI